MAKIGTAHIEVKPVLNEEALAAIVQQIETAVARGVERGLSTRDRLASKPLRAWRDGKQVDLDN